MKWEFIKNNKHIIIAHIAILLAVLASSEPFDSIEISPWVMVISLCLLLIYYFMSCVIKLRYIPQSDIIIAFCNIFIWFMVLDTLSYWSNLSGWKFLVYLEYPYIALIFFACLLAMNLFVDILKWVRAKKMQN